MRRPASREWAALPVLAGAAAGIVLLLAVYAPRWWQGDGGTYAPRALTVRTAVEPVTSLFGDVVTLRADVLVDRRAIDPESARVEARFTPFRVVSDVRRIRPVGGRASHVAFEFEVQCISLACLNAGVQRDETEAVQTLPIALRRGRIMAERPTGETVSARIVWPRVVVQSRLSRAAVEEGDPRLGDFPTLERSFAISSNLAGALLLGVAIVLTLVGAYLLARVVRGRPSVRRLRLPGHLTPLDRAVALVRDAAARDDVAEERRALERLAVELHRDGADDLADDAGRLAWSADRPSGTGVTHLIDSISRSNGGR